MKNKKEETDKLNPNIEAILFASDQPLTVKEIQSCITKLFGLEITTGEVEERLNEIMQKYHDGDFAFEVIPIAGGFQFLTKPEYHSAVSELLKNKMNKKLSTNALETLSVIAYKQPVSKSEIEQIRGVNCDYTVQKLLEKELIVIAGRSESVGHPLLYSTSPTFMNYFGLNSVADLPKLKDLANPLENEIGSHEDFTAEIISENPIDETANNPAPNPETDN